MTEERRPKVGVGVLVFKDGKLLLGQRKNAHGAGEFAGPGGHVEFGETFEECAQREVREETGIEIKNIRVIGLSNLIWSDRQYADVAVAADWASGEPKVCEPDKCASWDWYDLEKLPENIFGGVLLYIKALKTDKFYVGTKRL